MAEAVLVPRLGASMTQGTFLEWLVDDGAQVDEGQDLYVIATDKVETTVAATVSGTLRVDATVTPETDYPVGHRLGEIV